MWGISAHESNKIPVFDCTGTVYHYVADKLAIHFRGGIEPHTLFQHVMSQIVIDSAWDCYDSSLNIILDEIICQESRVCKSVWSPNQNQSV